MTDSMQPTLSGPSLPYKTIIIYASLIGLSAFYIYHCLYYYSEGVDDAYITFRYARNLNDGLGLVYNPGQRVEGYSNFSWLLLVALGMKLGFEAIIAAKILGVLSGIGAILCSYHLYNRLSPSPRSVGSLIAPLLLATNSFFCYWSFGGMETVFFSFIMVLSILLYFREERKRFPLSACFWGLLCLSRPEGVGYLGVFAATELYLRFRDSKTSNSPGRFLDRYFWQYLAVISFIILAYLAFKLVYFGSVLPNTYYCKVYNPFNMKNYPYILSFYFHDSMTLSVFAAGLAGAVIFCKKRVALLIAILIFSGFFIIYTLLDWMANFRFHMHSLPVLFTAIALGLAELVRRLGQKSVVLGRGAVIVILFLLVGHIGLNIAIDKETGYYERYTPFKKVDNWLFEVPGRIKRGVRPDLVREAMFLIENTDRDMTVGLRDIGFPGYISNCRVYDFIMLVDKEARNLYGAMMRGEKFFKTYLDGGFKRHLTSYNPDFFLFPTGEGKKFIRIKAYEKYFKNNMAVVKKYEYGGESISYYRKNGLDRRFSTAELMGKYERIVQEYPSYPVFRDRLEELRNGKKTSP